VKKMRRLVDHVLCSLPFEEAWFKERGCNAIFVGHPYFDEVRQQQLDQDFLARMRRDDRPLVTILPGSRTQEVTQNLDWFLRAAAVVKARVPNVRFAVAAYKPHQAQFARERIKETGLAIEVFVRKTPELIHLAECCMAVSGSVSLELLYQKKPTVILYWINRFANFIQARFRRVKYITLVNLLSANDIFVERGAARQETRKPAGSDRERESFLEQRDRVLFPEYLTSSDKTLEIAAHVIRWLVVEETREGLVAELAKLKARIGHGGASRIAADYILGELAKRAAPIPRPHFIPGMAVASSGGAVEPTEAATQRP
jgi:lipid-A-disaccharide synthase